MQQRDNTYTAVLRDCYWHNWPVVGSIMNNSRNVPDVPDRVVPELCFPAFRHWNSELTDDTVSRYDASTKFPIFDISKSLVTFGSTFLPFFARSSWKRRNLRRKWERLREDWINTIELVRPLSRLFHYLASFLSFPSSSLSLFFFLSSVSLLFPI